MKEEPKKPYYFILENQFEKDAIRIEAYTLHEAIELFLAEYDCKDFEAMTQAEYWRKFG